MTDHKKPDQNRKKLADQVLIKQLLVWRKKAINKVLQVADKKERIKLANKYYKVDQDVMNDGIFHHQWKEMERYIGEKKAAPDREKLITANSICQEVTYYKKAWLPTLEEYRQKYPFESVKTEKK